MGVAHRCKSYGQVIKFRLIKTMEYYTSCTDIHDDCILPEDPPPQSEDGTKSSQYANQGQGHGKIHLISQKHTKKSRTTNQVQGQGRGRWWAREMHRYIHI